MGKKILNFFGILFALAFSIPLFLSLAVTPAVTAASSLTRPETLENMVNSIDFSSLSASFDGGAEAELIAEFMETEMADEVISLFAEDFLAALSGSDAAPHLNGDALTELAETHMDELVPLFRKYYQMDETVSDLMAEEILLSYLHEAADELAASFPSPADLGVDQALISLMAFFREGIAMALVLAAVIFLSLLVFVFRLTRFNGFMWLGVVYILASLPSLLVIMALRTQVPFALIGFDPALGAISGTILTAVTSPMLLCTLSLLALSIVFILIFVLGRKARAKRKAALKAV